MKKAKIWIAVLLFCGVGVLGYHFSYPIHADQSNLEASIRQWLGRGYAGEYAADMTMYTPVVLDGTTYIPIELSEDIGYIRLEQGLTKRYKITRSSLGTGFSNSIVEAGGEKYLLFMGRNTFGTIATAKFETDDTHTYELAIPKEPVFVVYTPVEQQSPSGPVDIEKMTLYNAQGEDVTRAFDRSGGDIQ